MKKNNTTKFASATLNLNDGSSIICQSSFDGWSMVTWLYQDNEGRIEELDRWQDVSDDDYDELEEMGIEMNSFDNPIEVLEYLVNKYGDAVLENYFETKEMAI